MGKRKVESDEDEDWGTVVKKTSRASVTRTTRVAATARVKNEQVDVSLHDLLASTVAGPSSISNTQAYTSVSPAKDAGPGPSAPRKRVKKEAAQPAEEKRLARIRKSCPKNIQERLERVQAQRFFLVDRTPRNGDELREEFKVLGSTGNVYTIVIKHLPTCDCPDALKGNHCKHLLFILLKVLGVSADSPNIYQKALLTSELEEIFANAPAAPSASVQHSGLKKAWQKATGSPVKDEGPDDSGGKKRLPEEGDTCPICFDDFGEDMAAIVYCETSCGGPVHQVCIAQWLATKPEPTCIYCRAPWPKAGPAGGSTAATRDGAYLNLGGAVGISTTRDTTSYYHGPRRGMTQAQAYYDAAERYNPGGTRFADAYGGYNDWWE